MHSFNIATDLFQLVLKNRMRILKLLAILDKVDLEDTSYYPHNLIDKHKNRPDNLDDMCPDDFAASHVYEKADMNYESDDGKSFIKPVTEISKVSKLKIAITIKLKKMLLEKLEKDFANYDKILHYQQLEESRRLPYSHKNKTYYSVKTTALKLGHFITVHNS